MVNNNISKPIAQPINITTENVDKSILKEPSNSPNQMTQEKIFGVFLAYIYLIIIIFYFTSSVLKKAKQRTK